MPNRTFNSTNLFAACGLALAVVLAGNGCASNQYVRLRQAPQNPLATSLNLLSWSGPKPTDRTVQLLRRYDLATQAEKNPQEALDRLRWEIAREPSADKLYSYGELSYVEAKRLDGKGDPEAALDHYAAAVAHAYLYLFDPQFDRFRNPYDPQFRGACDLYNSALEAAMRIAKQQGKLKPGETTTIRSSRQEYHVQVNLRGPWKADEVERLEFVSDYELEAGLSNRHHTYGLGVPLIAVRNQHKSRGAAERFYPPGLSFPLTAFLKVVPGMDRDGTAGDAYVRSCVLELYYPHYAHDVEVGGRIAPLETDLTTPLAFFLDSPCFKDQREVATLGLLRPQQAQGIKGLYMFEPYDPHRIPVVMVHGIWSDPTTWMEMFNDLRAWRDIHDRYQFWFYLYPTGQPFWVSAAQLRDTLDEARQCLDPQRQNPQLDQTVLVGHSMGGLLSRLQTVESGDNFWKILSDRNFGDLKAIDEDREKIAKVVYFRPNPAVKRVITIGSPHRGSDYADYAAYLGKKLIRLPEMMVQANNRLVQDNPGLFKDVDFLTTTTSIDSLSPESPIFPVLNSAQPAPWVRYHNIVGVTPQTNLFGYVSERSDGVVSYASAHWEQAESELAVEADHLTVHRHPRSILEVRRILLEHCGAADVTRQNSLAPPSAAGYPAFPAPTASRQWIVEPGAGAASAPIRR